LIAQPVKQKEKMSCMTHRVSRCARVFLLLFLLFSSFGAQAQNPLKWKEQPIKLTVSPSLTENFKDVDVLAIVRQSSKKWEKVANVKFEVELSDNQTSNQSVSLNAPDGVNLITIASTPENTVFLEGKINEIAAKTKIFFDSKGNITEADIVLNPYLQFSTDGTFGTFDLEATLTHEIGHILGLTHSSSYSALMNSYQPKNGLYSIPQFFFRTLSADDISKARFLYGPPAGTENCCGVVKGRVFSKGKGAVIFQVWLEDFDTGKLQAVVLTERSGRFLIGGVETGKYRIFAQTFKGKFAAAKQLGVIFVEPGKTSVLNEEIQLKKRSFDADSIGINGQVSKVAIPVNDQRSYLIYVGGKNLIKNVQVKMTSDYFRILSEPSIFDNFDGNLTGLLLGLEVKEGTPEGEYTLVLENEDDEKVFLVGAIVVNSRISTPQNFFVF
jgi:hypothetical protein